MMSYKIGIFGSAVSESEIAIKKAKELGQELAKHDVIIITGACSGMPYTVASIASEGGKDVLGYSPKKNINEQKVFCPNDDINVYKEIIYIPEEFQYSNNDMVSKKYRNVISTANCDAGVIVSGRWGTLNEFTNLFDMGKVIGVLIGTGGTADELPNLLNKINKKSKAKVIFSDSPGELVENILIELNNRNNVNN